MSAIASHETLRQMLLQLDQRGYKAYKEIRGSYQFPDYTLIIDRVQGDPFATPSQCRVQVPQAIAQFPPNTYQTASRAIALRDYLTREFARTAQAMQQHRGTGNSGLISIAQPSQAILERTTVFITNETVEARFVVGLPAQGRRIAGRQAAAMFYEDLPRLIECSLLYQHLNAQAIQQHLETAEDADWLRQQLTSQGLIAFIPDGAILPRRSGVDERPLKSSAMPFQAPESLRVQFTCPNRGVVTGMGIPAGITLIVGGGYHGKSTLLQAIAQGIYNHIPGDGRELVVTHPAAVKIRAEDGRSIQQVDISPFINHLPQGRSTTQFSTENASGSTSQAANIIEALEVGAQVLLVDEDTAATNFMIRDRRMQALIAKDKEPITPFVDKVRQLYTDYGVSTILVMGGSSDYFEVADTVIAMEDFQPQDVTAQAQAIAQAYPSDRQPEGGTNFGDITPRVLPADWIPQGDRQAIKWKVRNLNAIVFAKQEIDLSAVEQLVEMGQLRAIATAMNYLQRQYLKGQGSLPEMLDAVMIDITTQGWDHLTHIPEGDLVLCRRYELAAAINRLRH